MLLRVGIPVCVLSVLAGHASAGILFSDAFTQDWARPEWSSNTKICMQHEQVFTWFSGRYSGNESVTLTLSAPPPPVTGGGDRYNLFTVVFDLYTLDSWDGNEPTMGPDRFSVKANGATIFSETFANQHSDQSMRHADVGPVHLGFDSRYKDSIYRQIAVDFTIPAGATTISLNFGAVGLQGLNDESWGLDNVLVKYEAVPAPGGLALLGLAGLARRGRRR